MTEVQQALGEYRVERADRATASASTSCRGSKRAYEDRSELFREGEDHQVRLSGRSAEVQRHGQERISIRRRGIAAACST